jgi:hypothetical protein
MITGARGTARFILGARRFIAAHQNDVRPLKVPRSWQALVMLAVPLAVAAVIGRVMRPTRLLIGKDQVLRRDSFALSRKRLLLQFAAHFVEMNQRPIHDALAGAHLDR